MVPLYEVRVRKQKERLLELAFPEIVVQVFHCIGADDGDVVKLSRMLARIRSFTYSLTLSLSSMPTITVFGKIGDSFTRRPPNPHPISANLTRFRSEKSLFLAAFSSSSAAWSKEVWEILRPNPRGRGLMGTGNCESLSGLLWARAL